MGLGFESEKEPKWEWDWCFVSMSVGSGHWLVGFGKKWWLGNGIGNPLSGPSKNSMTFQVFHDPYSTVYPCAYAWLLFFFSGLG